MESLWFFHYSVYSSYSVYVKDYSVYSANKSLYSVFYSVYSVICPLSVYSVLFLYSVHISISVIISNITHIPPGSFDLKSLSSTPMPFNIISRFIVCIVIKLLCGNICGYLIDILRRGRCDCLLCK